MLPVPIPVTLEALCVEWRLQRLAPLGAGAVSGDEERHGDNGTKLDKLRSQLLISVSVDVERRSPIGPSAARSHACPTADPRLQKWQQIVPARRLPLANQARQIAA